MIPLFAAKMTENRLTLFGSPGSPYTRKMLGLLRYRRIPYAILWGDQQSPPQGYPSPRVNLLPTFYFPDDSNKLVATVDSTPIIQRLERLYQGRAAIPLDPALAFINYLIEDYADEWLTKAMFHYRWYHTDDRDHAGPLLVYWSKPLLNESEAKIASVTFTKRQTERLYVVGSNEITAETIEASYERFIELFDRLISIRGYLFGSRPSSADFAIFGQLTQLGVIEPTSAAITTRFPRVRAWIDRVEDLCGLEPEESDWTTADDVTQSCRPILIEIGRVYAPALLANARAAATGQDFFETKIDGRAWQQPTFSYQSKCLSCIQQAYSALNDRERAIVDVALSGTGCELLLQISA